MITWMAHVQIYWFLFSGSGDEEVLNQVALPILPDSTCASVFPRGFSGNEEICAGYTNQHKDFCAVSPCYKLTVLPFKIS